jgi:PTH1 family peptidyl-tRNA hydrolase
LTWRTLDALKLLVALGNPGKKYEQTRHNAGFIVVDQLVREAGADWRDELSRFEAFVAKAVIAGEDCLAVKPQTFMNLSGRAVQKVAAYFKIPASDMVVLYDDVDVPAGKVKARSGGGHGGHNGVRSIIECVGTADFARVKLGVGKPLESGLANVAVADWVLAPMGSQEVENMRSEMAGEALLRLKNIFQGSRAAGPGN